MSVGRGKLVPWSYPRSWSLAELIPHHFSRNPGEAQILLPTLFQCTGFPLNLSPKQLYTPQIGQGG